MSTDEFVQGKETDEHVTRSIAVAAQDGEPELYQPERTEPRGSSERLREDTPTTYYESVVRVPGFGDAPNRCRGLSPVGFCEHGHPVLGRSSCGTRGCPDHWRDWNEDAVVSMVARLAAYRWATDGAEQALSHAVASPPQDRRYSVRQMWETRSEAYEAFEEAGASGGVAVTHPYRTNERGDAVYATAKEAGAVEDGVGRWRFLRELVEDWEELTEYVEASPHYHALVPTNYLDGEAAPEGWMVKNIRTVKGFHHLRDTEAYRAMVAPAYYILTHGAVQEGRQTVTYFGDVHPASFDPAEELTAAEWDRIQREAEKAVKTEPGEEGAGASEPEECPHDECEAPVLDLVHLADYLDDEDWVADLISRSRGRQRWLRLRGLLLWWEDGGDRPPPAIRSSESRLADWMEDKGRMVTPDLQQHSVQEWSA